MSHLICFQGIFATFVDIPFAQLVLPVDAHETMETKFSSQLISIPYVCLCVHDTAEPLDGVHELPDTQTVQQTDVNETY